VRRISFDGSQVRKIKRGRACQSGRQAGMIFHDILAVAVAEQKFARYELRHVPQLAVVGFFCVFFWWPRKERGCNFVPFLLRRMLYE